MDPKWTRSQFSVVMERMVLELQGVPCLELELEHADRQTIMASRSFGRPVVAFADMQEAVATYISRAAEKMRRQDLVTPALQVFITTNRFREQDRQYTGQPHGAPAGGDVGYYAADPCGAARSRPGMAAGAPTRRRVWSASTCTGRRQCRGRSSMRRTVRSGCS